MTGLDTMAQKEEFELISKIINAGNAKELVKQFNTTIDLNIDSEEASYSKAQAEAVLKDFFTKNPPESFEINHQGSSKSGKHYAIGEYLNELGKYRVWIRIKNLDKRMVIYEMSFIKDKE